MKFLIALAALFAATPALAQDAQTEEAAVQAAVDAVYAVISGPVDAERDWDAMRAMMTPDATLTPITANGPVQLSVEDYIERAGPNLLSIGFHEVETGNRIEIYGNLAHVWSAYEGRAGSYDGEIVVAGINSFQLIKIDGEWKVDTILWQPASEMLPVPEDLAAGESE